ncbi:putative zinc finger protein [Trypanosoma cruzi]|nr:putative zinc finger protein [Trypanosoma cruzi]
MTIRLSVLGEWTSDSSMQKCEICEVKFNFGCRCHHCRYCGGIFCVSCSSFFVKSQKLHVNKPRRVCRKCFEFLSKTPQATNPSRASAQSRHKELNGVNACNCESDRLTTESAQAATVVSWTPRRGEDRNTAGTFPDEENADDADLDDDDDDVSAALAGVYSSMGDGQHTGSLAFLAAPQDNLRYSEGSDVIHVLIYVSAARCQVILVTVSDGETVLMLAKRLVDVRFRLGRGSLKSIRTAAREILLRKLRFQVNPLL